MTLADLPPLKALLEREGLWANKGLGQHFLLDPDITRRIARAAGDLSGATVLEVGPGPGGLTRALLAAGAGRVVAVEKDRRFLPILEELAAASDGRLHIVHADALDIDERALIGGPARIVANLPYNVGTPLLIKWLQASDWRGAMTLMFQKEVADRIAATPGSQAYGRLSVLCQAICRAKVMMRLPRQAFTPPPKVASAVIALEDRRDRFPDIDALERVTAAAFGQRRKMLRSSFSTLAGAATTDMLTAAGLDPQQRAETVDPAGFCRLARVWRASQASS